MADQVTDTKFGSKYFAYADQMSGFKSDKRCVGPRHPMWAKGSFLLSDFKLDILICMYKIFWPKFSICDLICHVYILFEPVYNILHPKIQIRTFDSDNGIDILQEFNHVLGFSYRQIQHSIEILLSNLFHI